jgi:hypothetical protein
MQSSRTLNGVEQYAIFTTNGLFTSVKLLVELEIVSMEPSPTDEARHVTTAAGPEHGCSLTYYPRPSHSWRIQFLDHQSKE